MELHPKKNGNPLGDSQLFVQTPTNVFPVLALVCGLVLGLASYDRIGFAQEKTIPANPASKAAASQSPKQLEQIEFNRDIRPILSDRCFQCHGPDDKKREGDIRFDFEADAKKDLGGYRAIVEGDPDNSEMIQRLYADDPDERMPPESSGKKLTEKEKQLIKKWIQSGAPFQQHWAFQKPLKTKPPQVKNEAWIENEIDHFVLAKLEQVNVKPSKRASRQTLIRRLYLDLLGVLPAPAEVQSFVKDRSENAYEKLVDRLLQSNHFGERMGRHWLDLARYADSNGYANDGLRSIWPYRDWVIRAINQDLPFDQFTIEQLAGDLLPNATESQKVATGFHRNTPHQTEGGSDPEQYRVERTKNRTDTTGAVWLGLTVGCAQCHSHKFDPISHEEYYQLYAFFNNADEPTMSLRSSPDTQEKIAALQDEITKIKAELVAEERKQRKVQSDNERLAWWPVKFESVKSLRGADLTQQKGYAVVASGKNPAQDSYELVFKKSAPIKSIQIETLTDKSLPRKGPGRASNGNFVLAELKVTANGQPVQIVAAMADHSQNGYPVSSAFDGDLKTGWAINVQQGSLNVNRTATFALARPIKGTLKITMTTYEQGSGYNIGKFRVSTSERVPVVIASRETELRTLLKNKENELKGLQRRVPKTLAMSERAKPRESYIQIRGDFLDKGQTVVPNFFSVLHKGPEAEQGRNLNRLDLAKWIVSRENPLTSRVVVNRVWQRLFGIGLVETENDFGYQGALPSHPRLLDYLAVDLMENGWKMKRLYKKIAMSATYQQASTYRADLFAQDPTNKWLGRQLRYRVEGEIVRDLALSASGLLSKKMGGPSVFPPIPPNVIGTSSANHRWPESQGEDRYRRGIYTAIYRANVYPMLSIFDGPDRDNACTRRSLSNTPLQALTVANDPMFMEMARSFGQRLLSESTEQDVAARMGLAYRIAVCRSPTARETARTAEYFESLYKFYLSHPKATLQIAGTNDPELAGWVSVARVLLNLDEFITRE